MDMRKNQVLIAAAFLSLVAASHGEDAEGKIKTKSGRPSGDTALQGPTVSGYMQIHYRQAYATGADPAVDNDDFRVQRLRVGLEGDVYRWLSYDLEIDPRAPEVTGLLRDAYVTFKVIPRHKLRIGQQKQQFGYENVESSTRL